MDRASMRLHKMPDDGKAQTQPAVQTCPRGVRLPESFEHVRKKCRFNTNARVHDTDFCMALDLR